MIKWLNLHPQFQPNKISSNETTITKTEIIHTGVISSIKYTSWFPTRYGNGSASQTMSTSLYMTLYPSSRICSRCRGRREVKLKNPCTHKHTRTRQARSRTGEAFHRTPGRQWDRPRHREIS